MQEDRVNRPPRAATTAGALPTFDRVRILDHVDGDRQLLGEIIALFQEDSPLMFDRISRAVADGNADDLWSSAHALKGAIGNFAAQAAYEMARDLEMMGRRGELQSAAAACDQLAAELERLRHDLAAFANGELS